MNDDDAINQLVLQPNITGSNQEQVEVTIKNNTIHNLYFKSAVTICYASFSGRQYTVIICGLKIAFFTV